ncbi:hypothetical protein APT65_00066 [Trabzonvirus APT65]|uniref:Uncharacterized protein n=1 Tax=Aeromonas phage APT65 TaxID=2982914 RepID=A0A9E8GAC2_9CAUD|nr:hypothetical protein APT65_00066 [Aeromonas phage APT65]
MKYYYLSVPLKDDNAFTKLVWFSSDLLRNEYINYLSGIYKDYTDAGEITTTGKLEDVFIFTRSEQIEALIERDS